MRPLSTFALEIQRGEDHEPSRISVVLSTAPDADGVLRLSPQCMTLNELEGRSTRSMTSYMCRERGRAAGVHGKSGPCVIELYYPKSRRC